MAVKDPEAKKQVLTEIMRLMDRISGSRLRGEDSPMGGDSSEDEPTDDDDEPKKPILAWTETASDDHGGSDDEDSPSDEELDAMETMLAKHRGRK